MEEQEEKIKERDRLINKWYPLAVKMSKIVETKTYLHEDDRLSAALFALFKAAVSYGGEIPFEKFASCCIRRSIRDEAWLNRNVKLPLGLRKRLFKSIKSGQIPKKGLNNIDPLEYLNAGKRILGAQTTSDFNSVSSRIEADPVILNEMLREIKKKL